VIVDPLRRVSGVLNRDAYQFARMRQLRLFGRADRAHRGGNRVERISERFENAREVCEETLDKDEDLRSRCIGAPFMRDGALCARCTGIDDQEKKRGGRGGRQSERDDSDICKRLRKIFATRDSYLLIAPLRCISLGGCSFTVFLRRVTLSRYMSSPWRVRSILLLHETSPAPFQRRLVVEERDGRTEVTNCDFSIEQADE